jgi:hypothetical protein
MTVKDQIWKLVAKKLADVISAPELDELNNLLRQHPAIKNDVKWLSDWWQNEEHDLMNHNCSLFSKIQERILPPGKQSGSIILKKRRAGL